MVVKETSDQAANDHFSYQIPPYEPKPDESYMSEAMREHFRKILIFRKEEILNEMDRTKQQLQETSITSLPDLNDRATLEEEFSLELRTRDRERKFIKNIDDALHRLDKDEYGYCQACDVEIGIRRLEARPTAILCIDCKTLDEIREKQSGISSYERDDY